MCKKDLLIAFYHTYLIHLSLNVIRNDQTTISTKQWTHKIQFNDNSTKNRRKILLLSRKTKSFYVYFIHRHFNIISPAKPQFINSSRTIFTSNAMTRLLQPVSCKRVYSVSFCDVSRIITWYIFHTISVSTCEGCKIAVKISFSEWVDFFFQ